MPFGDWTRLEAAMNSEYESKYKNLYGEIWVFEYDYDTRTGVVRGSDIGSDEYAVVDGRADDLVMHKEERDWLLAAWQEAMRSRPASSV